VFRGGRVRLQTFEMNRLAVVIRCRGESFPWNPGLDRCLAKRAVKNADRHIQFLVKRMGKGEGNGTVLFVAAILPGADCLPDRMRLARSRVRWFRLTPERAAIASRSMRSMLVDFLVTDAYVRSKGKSDFPYNFSEGYAYMQNKAYGAMRGTFYGDDDAFLWMPKGLLDVPDQINYITARGERICMSPS
jgi:hypothetical protein